MTAVYILRHPQTTWNVDQRYQGRLESPLSELGIRQADQIAARFEHQPLDAVYSSPLQRARRLAQAIARSVGIGLTIDQRLTEIGQCPWEGLSLAEIERRYPIMYEDWYRHPDTVRFPDGESLVQVQIRSLSALDTILQRHPSGHVVVVTHSVVIQTLVSAALDLPLRNIHRLRVSNCGLTTLCGTSAPGSLLAFNATDGLFATPIESALAQDCVSWKERRIAS
jgi:probable phosphoglycerate mutase